MISYEWRGGFDSTELDWLHAGSFGHPVRPDDWWTRVNWLRQRSVGRCHARVPPRHGLQQEVVAQRARRQRVGVGLVAVAVDATRAAGCTWLHVDFERQLRGFYLDACGFAPTDAGLIALPQTP